jgi:hypothetical protein
VAVNRRRSGEGGRRSDGLHSVPWLQLLRRLRFLLQQSAGDWAGSGGRLQLRLGVNGRRLVR